MGTRDDERGQLGASPSSAEWASAALRRTWDLHRDLTIVQLIDHLQYPPLNPPLPPNTLAGEGLVQGIAHQIEGGAGLSFYARGVLLCL